MRTLFLFFLPVFLIATRASAQYSPYWQWAMADSFNTYANDAPRQVLAAHNGKAMWGRLQSIKLQMGGAALGNYALGEYDTAGQLITAASLRGRLTLLDAHSDGIGNWYLLGAFYDSLQLTNGSIIYRNPAGNDPDHFIMRLDAGTFATSWMKLVGLSKDATAGCFTILNNTIYLPVDSGAETQIQTLNTNSGNGSVLFRQGGRSTTVSIAVDAGGNILLAGSCAPGGINFNGVQQAPVSGNSFPAYLVRYTPTGTHRWHLWLNNMSCTDRMVNVAPGGIIYYTGNSDNAFMLGAQQVHAPIHPYDFIAARLDTNGTVAWVRQVDTAGGGDASLGRAHHAVVTPDTALAIFAETRAYMDWRDNVGTDAGPYYNSVVASFGKDSHTRWANIAKGDYTGNQQIATDGSDAVWVTGNGFSSLPYLVFDTMHTPVKPQAYNPYLAKLKLTPRPVLPNSIATAGADMGVHIYPNPAINVLRISFTAMPAGAGIVLRDITGQVLVQQSVSEREFVVDVQRFARGVYFLEINKAGARRVERIVLR